MDQLRSLWVEFSHSEPICLVRGVEVAVILLLLLNVCGGLCVSFKCDWICVKGVELEAAWSRYLMAALHN